MEEPDRHEWRRVCPECGEPQPIDQEKVALRDRAARLEAALREKERESEVWRAAAEFADKEANKSAGRNIALSAEWELMKATLEHYATLGTIGGEGRKREELADIGTAARDTLAALAAGGAQEGQRGE